MIIPRTKLNLRWSLKLNDAKIDKKVNKALKSAQRLGKSYAEIHFPRDQMAWETAQRLHGRLKAAGYKAESFLDGREGHRFVIHIQESNDND